MEAALINKELTAGIITAANILIDEIIKVKAEQVKFKDGGIESATNIDRVTSCEECEGKFPNWYFSASSAKEILKTLTLYIKT